MYLLHCQDCGTIYKARKEDTFVTDYGDELDHCLVCEGELDAIHTDEWIADLMFKVKGN